jgi:ATP-binding cassette subfamily C (CFTR/MRP) protein 1
VIIVVTKGSVMMVVLPVMVLHRWMYDSFVYVNATLARLEATSRSPIFVHFTQSIVGVQSIRAYQGQQEKFMTNLELHLDTFTQMTLLQQCALHWIVLRTSFLGSLITFAVGVIAITFGTQWLPAEYFAMALSYAIQLSSYLKSYVRQTAATESQFVAVYRVNEYCELKPTSSRRQVQQDIGFGVKAGFPSNSHSQQQPYNLDVLCVAPAVEFRHVYLKYEYGPLALQDISFVVNPGERIGVVGRTG